MPRALRTRQQLEERIHSCHHAALDAELAGDDDLAANYRAESDAALELLALLIPHPRASS